MQVQVAERRGGRATSDRGRLRRPIERVPRQLFGGGTSISGAIDHVAHAVSPQPVSLPAAASSTSPATAPTIAAGRSHARGDEAVAAGIGINGLPILALEPDLYCYYYDSVIGGPGAFMVPAQNYETFGDAILKKLITEIASNRR